MQHVLVVVPVVQRVNFKLVGGNPVVEVVQEANIKISMAKRHVNFVVRVNTTTLGVHGQKVIVRTVQLVNIPAALVLHHVQIVQLDNTHRQVRERAQIALQVHIQVQLHQCAPIARKVDIKPVVDNLVAQNVKRENPMVKQDRVRKVLVRIVELVNIQRQVLHPARIVKLVDILHHRLKLVHHAQIVLQEHTKMKQEGPWLSLIMHP